MQGHPTTDWPMEANGRGGCLEGRAHLFPCDPALGVDQVQPVCQDVATQPPVPPPYKQLRKQQTSSVENCEVVL